MQYLLNETGLLVGGQAVDQDSLPPSCWLYDTWHLDSVC